MPEPTILSWEDAGAPDLTGQNGALYNVLKWALPQLGWTIEEDSDDTNYRILFRNNSVTGSGMYLRIQDNASDHSDDARVADVRMFRTPPSPLTSDTGRVPTSARSSFGKSNTTNNVVRRWFIVGDDKRFWYFVYAVSDGSGYGSSQMMFFAGDLVEKFPGDKPALLLSGTSTAAFIFSANTYTATGYNPTIQGGVSMLRNFADTADNPNSGFSFIVRDGYSTPTSGRASYTDTGNPFGTSVDGLPQISRLWAGENQVLLRGYLPSVYFAAGNWQGEYTLAEDTEYLFDPDAVIELSINNEVRQFRVCPISRSLSSASSAGVFLFDFTEEWQ